MTDQTVQAAIEAVCKSIAQYPSYTPGQEVHPVLAARELQTLGIELTEEQQLLFVDAWRTDQTLYKMIQAQEGKG